MREIPSDAESGGQTAAALRAQLDRIRDSQTFASAPMLRQFLQYLVEQTLTGHAREVKEYAIGVDVFRRGPAFDPRTDTIVRVQARRLRAKLDDYYRRKGTTDPLVLEVPKGGYAVEWRAAEAATNPPAGAPDGDRASIVVLPFVNLSGDAESDFFTDGLTEELIGTLGALAKLKVVARTSAFHFKGRTDDIRKIGRDLGVRTALEGSVRVDQQRIRITAQLIDLSNGLHLWSQIFDRTLGAVFDIQEEITAAIVDALRVRLAPGERARLRPSAPDNADAYDHYLKGRYFWHRLTPADVRKSHEHMERAIALAPTYAAAHAGLAEAHAVWAGMQTEAPLVHLRPAREAAQRALALEPSAEAHCAMGLVLALADFDWNAAEREFRRSIALNPSYSVGRMFYAVTCLCATRRYPEAIDHLLECLSIDPLWVGIRVMLGQTLVLAGSFDRAIRELRLALAMDPNFTFASVTLALAHLGLESYDAALDELLPIEAAAEGFPNYLGHLGFVHARLGHRQEAEGALTALLQRFAPWVPGVDVAAVYNGLGDTESALQWLEQARRERSYDWLFVADDPRLRTLQSNPRFLNMLPAPAR